MLRMRCAAMGLGLLLANTVAAMPGERLHSEQVGDAIHQHGMVSAIRLNQHQGTPQQALAGYPREWQLSESDCLPPFSVGEWLVLSCLSDDRLYTAQAQQLRPDETEVLATVAVPEREAFVMAAPMPFAKASALLDITQQDVTGNARLVVDRRPGSVSVWEARLIPALISEGWQAVLPMADLNASRVHVLSREGQRLSVVITPQGQQTGVVWLLEEQP